MTTETKSALAVKMPNALNSAVYFALLPVLLINQISRENGADAATLVDSTTATTTTCPPPPPCARGCAVTDPSGCIFCQCPTQTCETITCPAGTICVMSDCGPELCFSAPTCVEDTTTSPTSMSTSTTRTCPPAPPCAFDCLSKDENGCYICKCRSTCQDFVCASGTVCEMSDCSNATCIPTPTCIPFKDPCSGAPNVDRCQKRAEIRWSYRSSDNTCNIFLYFGCTPSSNTFRTKRSCLNRCRRPTICHEMLCRIGCVQYKSDSEKCPRCVCPDPCQNVTCTGGVTCGLRDSGSGSDPEPYCPRKCPFIPKCDLKCPDGLEKNREGCVICKCKGDPGSTDER